MVETYTIEALAELPDADLNALAAELRGWRLQTVTDPTRGSFLNWVDSNDVGQCSPNDWQPATNRNQSGELLRWATSQGFRISIGCSETGVIRVGIYSNRGRFGAHGGKWPRAETIAFCAAMLDLKGRLTE